MKTLLTILLLFVVGVTFGQRAITQEIISYPLIDTTSESIITNNWEIYIDNILGLSNVAYTDVSNIFIENQTIEKSSAQLTLNGTNNSATLLMEANGTHIGRLLTDLNAFYIQPRNSRVLYLGSSGEFDVIKIDDNGLYFNDLPAKTSETRMVYIDESTHELAIGVIPAGGSTDYVSNVTFTTGTGVLDFTGQGSAFDSPISLDGRYIETAVSMGGLGKSGNDLYLSSNNTSGGNPPLTEDMFSTTGASNGVRSFDINALREVFATNQGTVTTALDWEDGENANITLSAASRVVTISNLPDGGEGSIEVTQNNGTNYNVTISGGTIMGTNGEVDQTDSSHTTIVYWKNSATIYYGYIYEN